MWDGYPTAHETRVRHMRHLRHARLEAGRLQRMRHARARLEIVVVSREAVLRLLPVRLEIGVVFIIHRELRASAIPSERLVLPTRDGLRRGGWPDEGHSLVRARAARARRTGHPVVAGGAREAQPARASNHTIPSGQPNASRSRLAAASVRALVFRRAAALRPMAATHWRRLALSTPAVGATCWRFRCACLHQRCGHARTPLRICLHSSAPSFAPALRNFLPFAISAPSAPHAHTQART